MHPLAVMSGFELNLQCEDICIIIMSARSEVTQGKTVNVVPGRSGKGRLLGQLTLIRYLSIE